MQAKAGSLRNLARRVNVPPVPRRFAKDVYVLVRMANAHRRLRPSFFLAGAMKAGTTSLFNNLVGHPQVAEPVSKEIRYFDFHFNRGERWYQAHFPVAHPDEGRIAGEASPSYMFEPNAPARIRAFAPNARVIFMLRDPVDRAYSHYQHAVRHWGERRSFEEAVKGEDLTLREELDRKRRQPSFMGISRIRHSYLTRGRYLEQLEPWIDVFGRDSLLVLRSEDYFEHPEGVFSEVLSFLGLLPWRPERFQPFNVARYDRLDPALRAWLYQYFKPHNALLYTMLGRSFHWEERQGE